MPTEKELFIKAEAGQLEAALLDVNPQKIGIICHPHPQFGGSMENNVVYALRDGMQRSGYSALRFNFRGVGRSDGFYAEGAGEGRDLLIVLQYCKEKGYSEIVLSGYSFGAWIIASSLHQISENYPLILVSPPTGIYDFSGLEIPPDYKCLIIAGTDDYICPLRSLKSWCSSLSCELSLVTVQGTDHFYFGKEKKISDAVETFLSGL